MALSDDNTVAWDKAIMFLNSEFEDNIDLLPKAHAMYHSVSQTKAALENQV